MKITGKDFGKRIIVNGGCDREVFVNESGEVVGIDQGLRFPIAIEFDNPRFNRFHSCYTGAAHLAKRGYGFWVREDMIKFVDEEKEMEDQDFQVGDEVESLLYGYGKIASVDNTAGYPIKATFSDMELRSFTIEGKSLHMSKIQSLFHKGSITREGNKIIIDPVKPVRNKWVNLYTQPYGTPVLGGTYKDKESALLGMGQKPWDWTYIDTIELKRKE